MEMSKLNIKKEEVYEMYQKGISVSKLAEQINMSKSTVYRYINEVKEQIRYPQLKRELKEVLLCKDLRAYLEELSYSDICLLRRKFNITGTTKQEKIDSIYEYLKDYNLLGVYTENLSKNALREISTQYNHNQITEEVRV